MSNARRSCNGARRAVRLSVLLLTAVLAISLPCVAMAQDVGVGDISLQIDLPRTEGRLTAAVGDVPMSLDLSLTNAGTEESTVRLFGHGVDVDEDGNTTLGALDGAPFLTVDTESVVVSPGESLDLTATVDPTRLPATVGEHYAALVIEAEGNDTVVVRAAQVIRIVGERQSPFSGTLVAIALLVLLGTAALAVRAAAGSRRRTREPAAA